MMIKSACALVRYTTLLLITLLIQGCLQMNQSKVETQSNAFSKFLRGTVYLENERYKIRACGSSSIAFLSDPNNLLESHFRVAGDTLPSLYIEANTVAENALDWQLGKLYFVSDRPQQCGAKLRGLDYLVESVDAAVQAQVTGTKVVVSKKDIYTQLAFAAKKEANLWKGDLQLAQGRRFKMSLQLIDKPCRSQSNNWYNLSAKISLNGEEYLACARKGDPVKQFASGNYSNFLSRDNAFIVLDLQQNSTAKLILDYRNGHPMIVNDGSWKMLSDDIVELNLEGGNGDIDQSIMLFQVFNNKELRLKGYSELLGNTGLRLLPIK